jgi:hypothetical protein
VLRNVDVHFSSAALMPPKKANPITKKRKEPAVECGWPVKNTKSALPVTKSKGFGIWRATPEEERMTAKLIDSGVVDAPPTAKIEKPAAPAMFSGWSRPAFSGERLVCEACSALYIYERIPFQARNGTPACSLPAGYYRVIGLDHGISLCGYCFEAWTGLLGWLQCDRKVADYETNDPRDRQYEFTSAGLANLSVADNPRMPRIRQTWPARWIVAAAKEQLAFKEHTARESASEYSSNDSDFSDDGFSADAVAAAERDVERARPRTPDNMKDWAAMHNLTQIG